jgi:hypothetical protein
MRVTRQKLCNLFEKMKEEKQAVQHYFETGSKKEMEKLGVKFVQPL